MELLDIIIIIVVTGFSLFGLFFGLFHTLGSLLGTVLGVYLASRYYHPAAEWLMGITGWEANLAKVVMFIVAFIIINRIVGIFFYLVDRAASIFLRLPVIKQLNRLLGLIFGFFEGVITVGVIIYFIERFPLTDYFMDSLANSVLAPYAVKIGSVMVPLLPEAIRILDSTVDYVEGSVL
ncbi:MAG: CvpA family protein [Candidatus Magasanikbacteria bacterium]